MTTVPTIAPTSPRRVPPGPRGHPLWGMLPDIQRDPTGTYLKVHREYGDIVLMRANAFHVYALAHPDYVKHVLQDNHLNYNKGLVLRRYMTPLLGRGLLTNEGDAWLHQRRLMQPAFHRQRLARFGQVMTDAAEETLARWQPLLANGEPFDVSADMMRLTLRVVGQTLFSAEVGDTVAEISPAMEVVQEHVNYRSTHLFTLGERWPTPRNRRFLKARAALDRVVLRIINERRRSMTDLTGLGDLSGLKAGSGDLLDMLLEARDADTGQGMTDGQLRDEVMTLFLAGHETTSNALSWAWYLLSLYPNVARRLRAELAEVLGGRTPTIADIPRLTYTSMVIEETMRLYPPAWALTRGANGPDEIGGYPIEANALIVMLPYVVHRHPAFWENPEGFDPVRFAPERAASRPRYAYFPFGGGPRQCIGNSFAMMEAVLVLATLAQHVRVDLVPGHPIALDPLITLRPKHGILARLENLRIEDRG